MTDEARTRDLQSSKVRLGSSKFENPIDKSLFHQYKGLTARQIPPNVALLTVTEALIDIEIESAILPCSAGITSEPVCGGFGARRTHERPVGQDGIQSNVF